MLDTVDSSLLLSSCHTKPPRMRRGASICEAFYKWQAVGRQLIAHSLSNAKLQHSCKFRTCKFSLSTYSVSMQIQAYITWTWWLKEECFYIFTSSFRNFLLSCNSGKNSFVNLLSGCILKVETPHPFKSVNLSNMLFDGYVICISVIFVILTVFLEFLLSKDVIRYHK